MGLMDRMFGLMFGGGQCDPLTPPRCFVKTPNKVLSVRRAFKRRRCSSLAASLRGAPSEAVFDRLMDAVNRLPRPALALGTLGLFVSAMVDPLWFATRMQGIALVPEPLWWLLGASCRFYFGARHQVKSQQFQREIVGSMLALARL